MTGQARDEEDNELYRRPQMTGQARDEEDNQLYSEPRRRDKPGMKKIISYTATPDDGTSQG